MVKQSHIYRLLALHYLVRGVKWITVSLVTLLVVLFSVLRIPVVQTYVAHLAAETLTDMLNAEVKIERVSITPFLNIELNGVLVKDAHQNDMIRAEELKVNIERLVPRKRQVRFFSIALKNAFVRIKKYESDSTLNVIQLFEPLSSGPEKSQEVEDTTDSKALVPFLMACPSIDFENVRFIYSNRHKPERDGFDWNNIDLQIEKFVLNNSYASDDSLSTVICESRLVDHSGMKINHMGMAMAYTPQKWYFDNVTIQSPNSDISFDFSFTYPDFDTFTSDFISQTVMYADIERSKVGLTDISYFSSTLKGLPNSCWLDCKLVGPVDKMDISDVNLSFGDSTLLRGDFKLTGLPNSAVTDYDMDIEELVFYPDDLNKFKFLSEGQITALETPEVLNDIGKIKISGIVNGRIDDFSSDLHFFTPHGELFSTIDMEVIDSIEQYAYQGNITGESVDIGALFKSEAHFGVTSFNFDIEGSGFSLDDLLLDIDGDFDSLSIQNYNYKNITIDGDFKQRLFIGKLSVEDENIDFQFDGLIGLNKEVPTFNFKADVKRAKLGKLNLFNREETENYLSTKAEINFTGISPDSIQGTTILDSLFYYEGEKHFFTKRLEVNTTTSNGQRAINLTSDFAVASISGDFSFNTISSAIFGMLEKRLGFSPLLKPYAEIEDAEADLQFTCELTKMGEITALFMPALELIQPVSLQGEINTSYNTLLLYGSCDSLAYNGVQVSDWDIYLSNADSSVSITNSVSQLAFSVVSDQDTLQYRLGNFEMVNQLQNDSLTFDINWNNRDSLVKNSGDISLLFDFGSYPQTELIFKPSQAYLKDTLWVITNRSNILIDSSNRVVIENFKIESGEKFLQLSGDISKDSSAFVNLDVSRLNLSSFDLLWASFDFDLNGLMSGKVELNNPYGNLQFLTDIQIGGFELNNQYLGKTILSSSWHPEDTCFSLTASSEIEGDRVNSRPFKVVGKYYPSRLQNSLDFNLSLDKLQLRLIAPFVTDFIENPEGLISGQLQIKGTLDKPDVGGNFGIKRGGLVVKYLKTKYAFNGDISIDNKLISLQNIVLSDTMGNNARLSGGISHDHMSDFNLDVSVKPDHFLCVNTLRRDNSLFYGTAFATGVMTVKGPFEDIKMEIKVDSNRGTNISIPINTTLDVSDNSFIIFMKDPSIIDTTQLVLEPEKETNFELDIGVNVDSQSTINVYLPSKMGNIKAQGDGTISMSLDKNSNFLISGEYNITSGSFLFRLKNIISRMFTLESGSSIVFDGDPLDATINMSAIYDLRTTLSGLDLPLDSASLNTRIPVECVIKLQGRLINPNISFGVRFPSLGSDILQMVYSKLDTTNEVEMTKQVFSLLVLNNFSFSAASSSSLANNIGVSTFTLLSNQVSNWLSQISKDVDIGFNYRPGDDISADQVELALQTQFFDNRVTVNGDIGYSANGYSDNPNNLVGDVNVEVKITPDGRFRANVFNRANDDDLLSGGYNNSHGYTQGIGISFGKDFDRISDLFVGKKDRLNILDEDQPSGKSLSKKEQRKARRAQKRVDKKADKKAQTEPEKEQSLDQEQEL